MTDLPTNKLPTSKRKVLLVGWDAADWKVIHPLMDAGKMPTVKRLVESGVMGNLATLQPALSPMLWTSIATGKRPFKHGVHGFSEPTPDGRSIRPITNLSRKTKAIWNILSQQGLRSNIVGWWPSHPAEPINGVMVSNLFQQATGPPEKPWPTPPGSVHPARLTPALAELRLNPNELLAEHILPFIPKAAEIDQDKDKRLGSCAKILAECTSVHAIATHLMQNEPWDFTAVYYDAIDHFCHGFMRYHPPRQEHIRESDFELYRGVVEAGYRYHDMMLATLLNLAGPDTTVILMSDHGFHPDHLRPVTVPAEPAGPAMEHRDLGIFVASGPDIKKDDLVHGLGLLDITPTLLHLFRLPVGEDMDGAVAVGAFETTPEVEFIPSWDEVAGEDGRHPADTQLNAIESAEAIEQLVALGYIEPPGPDEQQAVRKTERELQYNLARAYRDDDRHTAAAEILHELYVQWPEEHRFGMQLGLCYHALERVADLRSVVETLTKRRELDAIAAREELAAYLEESKAAEEGKATDDPELAKEKPPMKRDEHHRMRSLQQRAIAAPRALDYLWGCLHFAEGDHLLAVERFRKAAHHSASGPALLIPTGEAFIKARRLGAAVSCFRKAARFDPDNAHAWCGLARCAMRSRRARLASKLSLKAIGLRYHYPLAHYTLGVALARLGQTEEAVTAFQMAIHQNPNFAEAYRWLSWLHKSRLKDQAEAARYDSLAKQTRNARREAKRRKAEYQSTDWSPPPPRTKKEEQATALAEESIVLKQPLTIVSGLPRSGTSMLMQMLTAGGLEPFTDNNRLPDEDNPRGYFEHEAVKRTARDASWIADAGGRVVKVIAQLLPTLPAGAPCRVLLLHRDLEDVLDSQQKMLDRAGEEGAKLDREQLKRVFQSQFQAVVRSLKTRPRTAVLPLRYEDVVANPVSAAQAITGFLRQSLDTQAMASVVDPSLHRNKRDR